MRSFIKEFGQLLKNIRKDTNNQARIFSFNEDDLTNFIIEIRPKCGFYAHASFLFQFDILAGYPLTSPYVSCISEIYHPNIDGEQKFNNICLNILSNWSINYSVLSIINGLIFLLNEPNFDDPNNSDTEDVLSGSMSAQEFVEDRLQLTLKDSCMPVNIRYALWASKHKRGKFVENPVTWEGTEADDFEETDEEENNKENFNIYPTSQYSMEEGISTESYERIYHKAYVVDEGNYFNTLLPSMAIHEIIIDSLDYTQEFFYAESGSRYSMLCLKILPALRDVRTNQNVKPHLLQKSMTPGVMYAAPTLFYDQCIEDEANFFGVNKETWKDTSLHYVSGLSHKRAANDSYLIPSSYLNETTKEPFESQHKIYKNDTNVLARLIPFTALFRQTRWPFSLSPGYGVSNYFFEHYLSNRDLAEFKRASSHRLVSDLYQCYRHLQSDITHQIILIDRLTMSPLSPIFMRIHAKKDESISVLEWITPMECIRNPTGIIINNSFSSWLSLLTAAGISLLANWVGYLSRCEVYATLGHSRPTRTRKRRTDYTGIESLDFWAHGITTRPYLDLWPLALCQQVLRLFASTILKIGVPLPMDPLSSLNQRFSPRTNINKTAPNYKNHVILAFTDVDEI